MRQPRKWTLEEYKLIVDMVENKKYKWKDIAGVVKDTVPNTVAAYRRAIGCKHSSYANRLRLPDADEPVARTSPRIAVFDIETLPMLSYTWKMYDENLSVEQVVKESCMLSWAGKILGDDTIYSDILTPKEIPDRNTKRIATSAWDFLSACDVVVGHNYASFDVRWLNLEFLKGGLLPLKYTIVDTLQVARQTFRFSSNKMKFINEQLGIRNKLDNDGFILWRACDQADPEALKLMLEYNEGDTFATEDLFYKLRPYVKNLNVALYNDKMTHQCPVCGSEKYHFENYYYSPQNKYVAVRCEDCGCLARGKKSLITTEKRKTLRVNS